MEFAVARPDVVRSISQRWLLKFWKRHRSSNDGVPPWQAVEAENLSRIAENLSFLEVTGDGAMKRFLIRQHGSGVAKVYGSDCRGRYLDDVIPRERHPTGLMPYYRVFSTATPVYTICDVKDKDGRLIMFERLMLPFSNSGSAVDRIISAFEFICEDGSFDTSALVKLQQGATTLRLCAMIEAQSAV